MLEIKPNLRREVARYRTLALGVHIYVKGALTMQKRIPAVLIRGGAILHRIR